VTVKQQQRRPPHAHAATIAGGAESTIRTAAILGLCEFLRRLPGRATSGEALAILRVAGFAVPASGDLTIKNGQIRWKPKAKEQAEEDGRLTFGTEAPSRMPAVLDTLRQAMALRQVDAEYRTRLFAWVSGASCQRLVRFLQQPEARWSVTRLVLAGRVEVALLLLRPAGSPRVLCFALERERLPQRKAAAGYVSKHTLDVAAALEHARRFITAAVSSWMGNELGDHDAVSKAASAAATLWSPRQRIVQGQQQGQDDAERERERFVLLHETLCTQQ
jgi:plasmid stabilization system protein ParE